MGRKLYKPILKDGYHLVDSSENSNRVRGQACDKENKNPDIVEWEAVDAVSYKEMGEALAVAIIAAAAAGAGLYYVINNKVVPWWKSAALPWIKRRSDYFTSFFKGEKKYKSVQRANTGNKDKREYFIYVKGKAVKVSEEVYKAYWKITEHEKYLIKKDWKNNVIPFSALDYDGHFVDNIIDERIDLEKIVEVKMQIEELNKALATLTKKERELIEAIFYKEESLRSIGKKEKVSYQAIGKRRDKILEKLRKLLEDKF